MVRPQEEINYFAIMGLTPSATEAEIRKAYRKLSLALHPDKNLDVDPEVASSKFHEMQLAYEILMDPSARLAAAERNKAEESRKERREAYDGKRKEMAEELERREEEDRKKRFKGVQDEQKRKATLEKLREEGRKLREEKERKVLEAEEQARRDQEEQLRRQAEAHQSKASSPMPLNQPEVGPLDLTVRLCFPSDQFTQLITVPPGPVSTKDAALSTPLAEGLEARFGKLDSLIWKTPKTERKRAREVTAYATFKTLDSAFAAVKAGSQLRAGGDGLADVLEDVWIGWAAGSKLGEAGQEGSRNGEPARISWLRDQGRLSNVSPIEIEKIDTVNDESDQIPEDEILNRMKMRAGAQDRVGSGEPFPSFSFGASSMNQNSQTSKTSNSSMQVDLESSTLQKMREAERRRMEEAIRQVDEQPMYS